jgi:hypothetical protein
MNEIIPERLFDLYCDTCESDIAHYLRLKASKNLVQTKPFNTFQVGFTAEFICLMCETTWQGNA